MANYVVFLNPNKRPKQGIKYFSREKDAGEFATNKRKMGYSVRNRSVSLKTMKLMRSKKK